MIEIAVLHLRNDLLMQIACRLSGLLCENGGKFENWIYLLSPILSLYFHNLLTLQFATHQIHRMNDLAMIAMWARV